ncbi:hypothetical protein BDV93DRAFT_81206 [Ceratobasidium sp. AG-I]|nr:hypothetical protein BDV93DRAFT_81206 [Ceratobasidium sp. AG-I]
MDGDAAAIERISSARTDARALQQKKLRAVEEYIMGGRVYHLSPVTRRSTLLLFVATQLLPTLTHPHLKWIPPRTLSPRPSRLSSLWTWTSRATAPSTASSRRPTQNLTHFVLHSSGFMFSEHFRDRRFRSDGLSCTSLACLYDYSDCTSYCSGIEHCEQTLYLDVD